MTTQNSPVVGKTNGRNSSEYTLTRLFLMVTTGLLGLAVLVGLIEPERADVLLAAVEQFLYAGVPIAVYALTRMGVKLMTIWHQATVFAWEDDQPIPGVVDPAAPASGADSVRPSSRE